MDAEPMPLLLFLLVIAGIELAGGALVAWAGAHTLRERWILHRRGVRGPAIAERLTSRAGPVGIYRFLDTDGRLRIANAERVRKLPAVEVDIIYDPRNPALAREGHGLLVGIVGVLAIVMGVVMAGLAVAALVMLVGVWA